MSRPRDNATHAGFAQFADLASRDRFLAALDSRPDLKARAYLPERRPTIVFENLSSAELAQVRKALEGLGKWFDDVRFES